MVVCDFIIEGTPISAQGSSDARRAWKKYVADRATVARGDFHSVDSDTFTLRIAYFYESAPAADLDNIIKPIQDALKGIIYGDDNQVSDLIASMRDKPTGTAVPITPALASAFTTSRDFLHVRVNHTTRIEAYR